MSPAPIRLFLADVDGTLVTHDKVLTDASIDAVRKLRVTHPDANKGTVAQTLARRYGLSASEIATIGDMPNDVLMFAHSGLSIAMGNADPGVRRAARRATHTNDDEGFAMAVERFVLPQARGGSSHPNDDQEAL